jgi:hypothetical protein
MGHLRDILSFTCQLDPFLMPGPLWITATLNIGCSVRNKSSSEEPQSILSGGGDGRCLNGERVRFGHGTGRITGLMIKPSVQERKTPEGFCFQAPTKPVP